MADSTLNIDWRTTVVAKWANVSATFSSSNDHFATAVTSASTKWLNVAVDPVLLRAQPWSSALTYFKMRGMDQLTDGLYATWVVSGAPDFAARQYSGGLNLPLRDVTLVASWTA